MKQIKNIIEYGFKENLIQRNVEIDFEQFFYTEIAFNKEELEKNRKQIPISKKNLEILDYLSK